MDASDYLAAISGSCCEDRLDRVFEVFAQVRASSSCRPDASTYRVMIDACAARDLHDSGMLLLEEMVDDEVAAEDVLRIGKREADKEEGEDSPLPKDPAFLLPRRLDTSSDSGTVNSPPR